MSTEEAVAFLRDAADYFRNREWKGEDRAYWANIHNAENCLKIIDLLQAPSGASTAKFQR